MIHPISSYDFHDDGYFFQRKSKFRSACKWLIVAALAYSFLAPKQMAHVDYEAPRIVAQAEASEELSTVDKIESYIKTVADDVGDRDARKIAEAVTKHSDRFGVPPSVLLAVVKRESMFDKNAINPGGGFGLMQIIPKWHMDKIRAARKELGNPELFNIDTNVFLGAWVIKECKSKVKSWERALTCYQGGTDSSYPREVLKEKRNIDRLI